MIHITTLAPQVVLRSLNGRGPEASKRLAAPSWGVLLATDGAGRRTYPAPQGCAPRQTLPRHSADRWHQRVTRVRCTQHSVVGVMNSGD